MTKSKLRQTGFCLIAAVIFLVAAGCPGPEPEPKEKENETTAVDLDKIFKIFNTFEAENYTPPAGFDTQNTGVTYGTLEERQYNSTTTGVKRKCMVYTPPNYNLNKKYPVLYLLHGIGGTHTEWTVENAAGPPKTEQILNNLINAGKAKPMIVVMPNVRAMNPDSVPSDQTSAAAVAAFHNFINDLRDDLMPFIASDYSVSNKRYQTAIAGLSMGGMESLHIGCRMYEDIGYVGGFSSAPAMPLTAAEQTVPDEYKDKTFFMLCCGTEDGTALTPTRTYNTNLTNNGVETAYYETTGVHDFAFWNKALYYFAQCIF